jgi:hypothetical protein
MSQEMIISGAGVLLQSNPAVTCKANVVNASWLNSMKTDFTLTRYRRHIDCLQFKLASTLVNLGLLELEWILAKP